MNVSGLTQLEILNISSNPLATLDLSTNTQLRDFLASNNQLTTLDLSANTNLSEIELNSNNLTSINLSGLTQLAILNLNSNPLVTLDVSDLGSLQELYLNSNPDLTGLDLSNNTALRDAYLRNSTSLSSITFGNNPMLRRIVLSGAAITDIDVSTLTALRDLEVNETGLTVLDVSANTALSDLDASDTAITSLDLSANTSLNDIVLENTALSFLNVRNGNNADLNDFSFRLTNNPNLFCILVDNVTYSTNTWTQVDAQVTFSSTFCRYTAIPDSNFEAALNNLGYDDIAGDGQVPTALIEGVTSLNVGGLINAIQDLTGIEAFVALENLNIDANNISTLDVTANTNLRTLSCEANGITSINLTGLTQLEELVCRFNLIGSLDLTSNTNLRKLDCRDAGLSVLDVSMLPLLVDLDCRLNFFTELNIRNGNNVNFTNFNAINNPNLTCILVDDVAFAEANFGNVDATARFTATDYCNYTAIPDTIFEAALENLGYDDISGDGQVPTALIEGVTSLDFSLLINGIQDLTGIEDFTALEHLNISFNNLTTLDLTSNTNLITLACEANGINTLNLTGLTQLEELVCKFNTIGNLDLSTNTNLRKIDCNDAGISVLDVSMLPLLVDLDCRLNFFTELNIRNGNNANFTNFNASNNANLACILVDDVAFAEANFTNVDATANFTETDYCDYTAIPDANFEARLDALGYDDISGDGQVPTELIEVVTTLNVSDRNIADLTGIEAFTALTDLDCKRNLLTSLDVQNNTLLETLNCERNLITSLDFQNNPALTTVVAKFNLLTSLNIQNNALLEVIDLQNNNLASVDVFNNSALRILDLERNNLTAVDVTNNTQLTGLVVKFNNSISQLDISQNTALQVLLCNNTGISVLDMSNNPLVTDIQAHTNNSLTSINLSNSVSLEDIKVYNTSLSTLDVANCTALRILEAYNTDITSLDLRNNTLLEVVNVSDNDLSALDVKNQNNTAIINFNATNNPNLTCIAVDDVAYSTTNWTNIDAQTSFSEFCRYTIIPDPLFEAELEASGFDDISNDGQVPTALIEVVTSMTIGSAGITDITGIEDFAALENLTINENTIVTVNLSANTQLKLVEFNDTTINNLVFDNNPLLESIEFEGAGQSLITDLDLSNSPLLQRVDVNNVGLVNLTLPTALPNLEILFISGNNFASLDASGYPALQRVSFSNNPNLSYLDLRNGNNTNILSANLINLPSLNCILVDDVAYAETNFTNVDAQISFNAFDCIPPTIMCPTDITAGTDAGNCGAEVTVSMPTITDNVTCVQSDDLESYTVGPLLGQGGDWDTWTPNTPEQSSNISTEQARSGTQSMKVTGIPDGGPEDMSYSLGNRSFGAWELTTYFYIPSGSTGSFNIQKTATPGEEFANQIAFLSDGTAIYFVNNVRTFFDYPQDAWFEVKLLFNIDGDQCEFFVNNVSVITHPYSYSATTTDGSSTLGSITFYPATLNNLEPNPAAIPLFYVDDLSLCPVAVNDYNNTTDASDTYDLGATDVVWTFTDEGGNVATCTQVVTVNDTEAPTVNFCPEDITVNACEATVTFDAPLALDNCETPVLTGFTYLGNFNNKAYYLSDATFNAPDAFTDAEAQNGFVATVDSQELNQFLTDATNAEGTGSVLIGYTDRAEETVFEWHDGSTTDYLNWNDNEPNDFQTGEDYVELRSNGRWNDINSSTGRKYVLQFAGLPMTQIAGLPSGSVFPLGTTTNTFEATDTAGNTITCSFEVTIVPCVTTLRIQPKIYLQGAALNPIVGEENLMRDDLRVGGLIPTRSPYADMISCDPTVFSVTGNDAIVDWVWVELRDASDNTMVRHASSALLQRDGDVVAVDGISPLEFSEVEETYYVAIKHRNHLGIMSNTVITFVDNTTEIVDFTTTSATFGSNAQTNSGMPSGVMGMWCGNANEDTVVQYSGTSPDTPNVLSEVLNDAGNFLNFPTFSIIGYNRNDINMDGIIQYSGTNPDTPFILQNVLAHPNNFLNFSTYQIIEQLPENIPNTPN
jgi:Leucine-rich repeat (LRR) protein